jgi:hypothetical protein
VIGYGIWGVVDTEAATNPPQLLVWVVGGAVVHDLLVAPIATVVALAIWRHAPRRWAGPVAAALAIIAVLVVFAYPLLRGFGRRSANVSALPRDYWAGVAVVLAAVWSAAAAVVVWRTVRQRRAR